MSYSMREPEEEPACECRYDEEHDVMDREDCPFHGDLVDNATAMESGTTERKGPRFAVKKDAAA
jgi:hypothetical protein